MNKTARALLPMTAAAVVGALIGGFGRKTHLLDFTKTMSLTPAMRVSVGLWLLFSVYWSLRSKDRAPSKSSESILSRQLHVIAVNLALLLVILPIPGLTRRFLPEMRVLSIVGLGTQAAAFVWLAISARRHLGSNWSGEVRIANGHELVRSGPYRCIRHPIYTALHRAGRDVCRHDARVGPGTCPRRACRGAAGVLAENPARGARAHGGVS